jgi:hypothetical protein
LIFPNAGALDEIPEVAIMYAKTHNNIEPGAQKKCNYAWGDIQPENHMFGHGEHVLPGGAARAIHLERNEEFYPKTVIVKKLVED